MMTSYERVKRRVGTWLFSRWADIRGKPVPFFIVAAVFSLIPIAIFGPLYKSGFILQYDMVFAPYVHINWEAISQGTSLHHGLVVMFVLKFFSFILPMDIVQKIILSAIFLLAALSVYMSVPVQSKAARVLAGMMYSINPFTYDRLMAGHWLFLLAYSVTPFVLRAFYNFYTSPSRKNIVYAVMWWAVVAIVSSHHLLLLGLLFIVLGCVFVRSWRTFLSSLIVLFGVLALNIWWIVPIGSTANFTQSFGIEHLYAFATRPDPMHGLWVNMLSLQGFWYAGWLSVKSLVSFWPIVFLVWMLPVFIGLAGFRTYATNQKKLLLGLVITGILALIFAAGPHPSTWQLNTWLHTFVPGMSGMREAQKFLALLALMYAVLAAFGLNVLLSRRRYAVWLATPIVTIAIILMALPIFWGAHGQMKLSRYPDSWRHLHDSLYEHGSRDKVVVLPWSIYTSDTFVPVLVGNPARVYFGDRAIVSQKMNLPGVPDQAALAHSKIEKSVAKRNAGELADAMRHAGARYILITDSVHKKEYAWLLRQPDVKVVADTKDSIIMLLTKH